MQELQILSNYVKLFFGFRLEKITKQEYKSHRCEIAKRVFYRYAYEHGAKPKDICSFLGFTYNRAFKFNIERTKKIIDSDFTTCKKWIEFNDFINLKRQNI